MKTKQLLSTLLSSLALTLAMLGALTLPGVLAADISVNPAANDGDPGSLRAAISTANSNGEDNTITLPAGVYTLTLTGKGEDSNATGDLDITSSQALTIAGAGADQTIIDANGIDRVLHIHTGTVVISGVTIYNGSVTGISSGGGIYNVDANLTLINTIVYGNSAAGSGGGVSVSSGSATLMGAQVLDNLADYGGGVSVSSGSATLMETQILGNSAEYGGGVHVDSGSATLTETQVLSNSAYRGGGVYVSSGSATFSGGGVNNNNSVESYYGGEGGGVYVSGGSVTLMGTRVLNNSADNHGGGVYVSGGSATLMGTHVLSNSVSTSILGGGLYVAYSGVITTVNGCIVNNSDTAVFRDAGTLNASDNWWGAANGPGGAGPGDGDTVSEDVNYTLFKTSAPAGCPTLPPPPVSVAGVYPAANTHTASLTATLSITFGRGVQQSGDIQQSSVTTQTVFVHGGMHGQMDGAISFASILYDPTQNFFPGELVQTSVTTGVLDSDGAPIAPYVWQFRAAVSVGPATFGASGVSLGSSASYAVALGDVDGDGDLDAFVGNYGQANKVWLNDGGVQGGTPGNFSDSGASLGSSYSYAVALGDVDGDGDLDAFVGNHGQANKVWLNDGGVQGGTPGNFSDSGNSLGSSDSFAVALGDVDGDGDLDAFVGNYGQANKVWLNDGAGSFSDSGASLGSSDSFAVALGDVDGDGDLDAFVVNYNWQSHKVWLNDGAGNFRDSGNSLVSYYSVAVALGDVDGDGDLDAFVGNYTQGGWWNDGNQVWLNDGGVQGGTPGSFSDSGASLGSSASYVVDLGDMDGDSDLDAFVGNKSQTNKVWLNDGAGNYNDSGAGLGSSDSYAVALGDVDGDGDLDAFVGNDGQANKVWLNQPSEIDVQGNGQSIPNGSTIPSTANHTNFGRTDVSGGTVVRTFSISNSGTADLNLTGSPAVTLTTGAHFSVTAQPSSPVINNSTTTFNVTFDPSAAGSFTDTVNIASNDADDNPYTFVISGTGAITMPTYILTVNISGNGRVDLDPPGTQGAGTLNFSSVYTAGTVVTITATADTGWRFDGWSGDASGTVVFPLLMDSSKAVTAAFSTNRIYLPLVLK